MGNYVTADEKASPLDNLRKSVKSVLFSRLSSVHVTDKRMPLEEKEDVYGRVCVFGFNVHIYY